MPDDSKTLPVSIYCVWQWWEKHYQQRHGRPKAIDLDWLDRHYLGRQRFLFEQFGAFGIGQESSVLNKSFVSTVLPYHTIIVPVLLGVSNRFQEVGGYAWDNLSESALPKMKPVNMAESPVGEVVARLREVRLKRYGVATAMIDLASAANNAFTLRGPDFYADLLSEPEFVRDYLATITETMCLAYRFVSELFGPINGFPLGNCNVVMMSPATYSEMIRPYDIQCVEFAAKLTGQPPCCHLHHCNVRTEPFAETYSAIPGLQSLQGSHRSDIAPIRRILPQVRFSAMINPVDLLTQPLATLEKEIDDCLAAGADDLAIWDIDPAYGPEPMRNMFKMLERLAIRHGRKAAFSVTPYSWEELDWEFPRYGN